MNPKDLFSFDVRGFFVVRGAAQAALTAGAADEIATAVLDSALLRQYVEPPHIRACLDQ